MQITKKDILQIIGVIQVNYAYAYKDMSKDNISAMADIWLNSLKIYPKDIIYQVLQYTLEKSTYPPTLADLTNNLKELVFSTYPNANELWNEIAQAITITSQIYYFGEQYTIDKVKPKDKLQQVFDNLNELCQEWLSNANTLKNMRLYDTTTLACEKARFIKDLPHIFERLFMRKRYQTGYIAQIFELNLKNAPQPPKIDEKRQISNSK